MAEQKRNTIVVLEPCANSARELVKLLEEKNAADILRCTTQEEALQNVVTSLPCMLIASINDNQDVPLRVQLFKRLESAMKNHGLKVYVVTPIKNRQLADLVTQKMGVTDFIVEPVPVRTMQFKANLQLKALDNFRRQQEIKKAAAEQVVIKKLDNGKKADPAAAGTEVKTSGKPALQAGADTFLFKNSGVKKAGKKFTVELEGPDPSTGEWVPHEDKGDAQTAWRWVPNEEKDKQAKGELPPDGWVHQGDKPQFNENSQKWAMTSEKPSLALKEKGKIVGQKLGVDEAGEVFVAEDSPAAEENLRKNREKAAVERKKREDEKKALVKEANKAGDEEIVSAGKPNDAKGPAADAVTLRDGRKAASGKKENSLKSLLADQDGEDKASAGVLKDGRGPSRAGTALKDKRDPSTADEHPGALEDAVTELKADADPKTALGGPLAMLKRKKDELRRATLAKTGNPDEAETKIKDLQGDEDEENAAPGAPRERRSRSPREEALARLSQKLSDAAEDDEITETAPIESGEDIGEEGEDGGTGLGRPSLKAGKGRKSKARSRRDDDAALRGETNDHQSEGASARLLGMRDARAKADGELRAMLEKPLPEKLSAEEEEELREELGLKGRPEISAKELTRRKRAKDTAALKKRLADLDADLAAAEDEEGGAAITANSRTDTEAAIARRQGDLTPDQLKGITGAYDGEEALGEREEELRKRRTARQEEKAKKGSYKDKAEYLPEADLLPLGNAWESAGSHYVYLDAKVRYKGFGKLEDLFPLWIFEGEDVPQLLDKTKQWRFFGGLPFQAQTVAEVPKPVRDFLLGLRDQLRKEQGLPPAGDDDAESAADDHAEAKAGEGARAKARDAKIRDLGKGLDELMSDGGEEFGGEFGAEETETRDQERAATDERRKKMREALGMEETADGDETDAEAPGEVREDESDPEATNARVAKKPNSTEDSMARLRAKLGMDESEEEASADERAERDEEAASDGRPEIKNFADSATDEPAADAAPEFAGVALAKSKSEGVQKFLEKRRQKLAEGITDTAPTETKPAAPREGGYLGIYVALSDAYGNVTEPSVSIGRVLGSVETSFRECVAYFTTVPDAAGSVSVSFRSPASAPPPERLPLAQGIAEPVKRSHGGSEEVLGYLYLGATGSRAGFTEIEAKTFQRLATKIWPLVSQVVKKDTESKAA